MLLNRHHPTHPQSVIPAVMLPPPHRPTDCRLPNASPFTDQVGRWYSRWVGGLVEFLVIPLCLDEISYAMIFTMRSDQKNIIHCARPYSSSDFRLSLAPCREYGFTNGHAHDEYNYRNIVAYPHELV